MPNIPVTGDRLYDFVLVLVLVIAGAGLALKADKSWGWILVALAGIWGFMLLKPFMA